MSLNRYAKRRDTNESELVRFAEALGAMWIQTPPLDGWVFWRGRFTPVEIKHGNNTYTDSQVSFLARCKEREAPVWTWRTTADVARCLGARIAA